MKKFLITLSVIIFFILSSLNLFADFREDEKPVWGMMNETAYTLSSGEWNIDLWGPVTYGVIDNLQIGTMFWVWFVQAPNVYGKFNIIPETGPMPALSVGGSFAQFSVSDPNNSDNNVTIRWYQIGGYISKELGEALYLSLSYVYNGVDLSTNIDAENNAVLNYTGTANSSKIIASFIKDTSKVARLSIEGVANLGDTVNFDAGAGFEWAMGDTFRLKLGIYTIIRDNLLYLPFIDLHWRFK